MTDFWQIISNVEYTMQTTTYSLIQTETALTGNQRGGHCNQATEQRRTPMLKLALSPTLHPYLDFANIPHPAAQSATP